PSPGTALPHRGQVTHAASAPSSPRTFLFVNTAGAVPGEASVARIIARSSSLREPGCLVVVAPVVFSNRGPLSNLRPRYVCNGLTNPYKLQVDSFVKAPTTTKIPIRVILTASRDDPGKAFTDMRL